MLNSVVYRIVYSIIVIFVFPSVVQAQQDPVTKKSYNCYFIQYYNWNYGGDGVGVVRGKLRWPSSTCKYSDGPPANRPLVIFMHGNDMQYTDHGYLLKHLALNGFVTASIENGFYSDGQNEDRAREAISYLNSMHRFWSWRNRLSNDVVYAGHSRGGEAAVTAARMIADDDVAAYKNYKTKAVISIAPTDGGGSNAGSRSQHETLYGYMTEGFLGIYGSHDPDVKGNAIDNYPPPATPHKTVFAIYDRAGSESSSEGSVWPGAHISKAMVFIHKATHKGFQPAFVSTLKGLLSTQQHKDIAKGYFNAFLRWKVYGETLYRDYFTGELRPSALLDIDLFHQLHDGRRRAIDNFEQSGLNNTSIGGVFYSNSGIVQIAENNAHELDRASPHDTRALRVKWWQSQSAPLIYWSIPSTLISGLGRKNDVSDYNYLSLRVAQNYQDNYNAAGSTQDFYFRLFSQSGYSQKVQVSSYGEIPYPIAFTAEGIDGHYYDYTKSAMNTIRIPLNAFSNIDIENLTYIAVYFDVSGHQSGSVVIDSLEFVK